MNVGDMGSVKEGGKEERKEGSEEVRSVGTTVCQSVLSVMRFVNSGYHYHYSSCTL